MKIICTVEVRNRALPSLNLSCGKAVRSSLAIVKFPDNDIFVMHHTSQNVCGKKYKIKNNIANVFVKFVNEGKATIRFKEPEHDLAIKCDPIQLKGFLKTLKLGLQEIPTPNLSTIHSNTSHNKLIKPPKTKLTITSKEEYPVLEGFPRTLENLFITNANQRSLDNRILRLRNLRILSMENNNLTTLPEQLGASLPNLVQLHLAYNSLGLSKDWRWIVSNNLQKQLCLLDLRSNEIDVLPDKLVKLENLVTLKLDNNSILTLPNGMGCLKRLRYLSASNNKIGYLPGSIVLLNLESLDFSKNPFHINTRNQLSFEDFQFVPSLVDLAASRVITKRLPYTEETLPRTLIEHLRSASFCVCCKPCFSMQPASYITLHNNMCSASIIVSSHETKYILAIQYCSFHCYIKSPLR